MVKYIKRHKNVKVFTLTEVMIAVVVLVIGVSSMSAYRFIAAHGVRLNAIRLKNEVVSMLAAEAGYEKAIFWMSQQSVML